MNALKSPDATHPAQDRPRPKIARSRISKWRIGVLIGIHVLFALHLAHWKATGKTMTPLEPSEAMEFSKRSVINAGFIFFALIILSTAFFGRFFCGWGCHLVFVQDMCASLMKRFGITPRPLRSRTLAIVPFLAAFYLFVWPFVERSWYGVLDVDHTLHLETSKFWATFPGLVIGIVSFLVAGCAVVFFLGSKGFCVYACPYGAFFNVADRVAPMRILVNDDCAQCGHCSVACTSNVAVAHEVKHYGMVVDPDCLKTLDCVSVCPNDALRVGFGKPSIAVRGKVKRRPRFTWGYELLLSVGFLASFLTFRGLYGQIPFLLALGIAGCFAYFLLRFVQLFTQPRVTVPGFTLKERGQLTGSGKASLVVFALLGVFWGHSAWVRALDFQCQRTYKPLIPIRDGWFTQARPEITDEIQATAREVVKRSTRVLELGLFETPRCRVERAWASMILGDTERFMQDMAVAAELAPSDLNTVIEPAHFLRASGRIAESLPLYLEGTKRDPDEPQVLQFLVEAAQQAGQIQVAVDRLQAQSAARDWDSVAREYLGVAQMIAGRPADALPPFEESLHLASEPLRIQRLTVQVARLHLEGGSPDQAVQTLREGMKRLPTDMHLPYVLAQVLASVGNIPEARDVLERALEIEPQNETVRELLNNLGSEPTR
ncbi:MAG: tetratricopeptide repeat protein [Planctomycetes bacterium]|nr:tetratricopeptide repeat protein [Planctomycetota bacterium]